MSTNAEKTPDNKNQSDSPENSLAETEDNLFEYEDNRSVSVPQRKLQERDDNISKTNQTLQLQSITNNQFDQPPPSSKKSKKWCPLRKHHSTSRGFG